MEEYGFYVNSLKDENKHFYKIEQEVSIGTNPTFKVKKVPMEYVPTMSKRFQFFGSRFLVFNIHIQYSIGTFLTLKGLLLTGFKNADS